MPHINPDKVADIIKDVALEKIAPRFRQLDANDISEKTGPSDLVTIADLEAEIELTKIFKDILPGSYVVGEEAVSKKEVSTDILGRKSDPIWVIDPVDGTYNFAHGNPKFGTIVALTQGDEVVQSWIYDIPNDRFAISEKEGGVEISGVKTVYPQMRTSLNESRGFVGRKFLPQKLKDELKDVLDTQFANTETFVCCAHEYLAILTGEAYYSLYSKIMPWDHLAGAMMLEEAGGYVRKWDGSHYRPSDIRGGLICTPNEKTWQEIYNLLLKNFI